MKKPQRKDKQYWVAPEGHCYHEAEACSAIAGTRRFPFSLKEIRQQFPSLRPCKRCGIMK